MKYMLMLIVGFLLVGCGSVGEGSKIGQVVKINKASGYFCKSVEVEIIRGGFNSGSGVNGGSLHFTVEDKSMLTTLENAMEKGQEVEVTFNHEFMSFCRSDSQSMFGTYVKVITQDTPITGVSGTDEILKGLIIQNALMQKLLATYK
ncbi:MAG: hypothetical protein PHF21_02725 [Bacilli bacterium]|nr:hypothetical protein [Bacilli bacterium]